jgi:4-hydroxyphenylpyruvate dioxygenase-like putative hemolysin
MDSTPRLPESALAAYSTGVDHLAIAVTDLDASIAWYCQVLGAQLIERRVTEGKKTGMISAVLTVANLTHVLLQGIGPDSQVSRFIDAYGPGVQHIAVAVSDLYAVAAELDNSGVELATSIIEGAGIRQLFTRRDPVSGMMYELIERYEPGGHFTDESVRELFLQLESRGYF